MAASIVLSISKYTLAAPRRPTHRSQRLVGDVIFVAVNLLLYSIQPGIEHGELGVEFVQGPGVTTDTKLTIRILKNTKNQIFSKYRKLIS